MRWGLGPVFRLEWLITSRRWQFYAARSLFVVALLIGLVAVWWSSGADAFSPNVRAQSRVGQGFFFSLVGTQLALVLLAAPAATAGSIGLDRARGMLVHLLVTDLSDAELVLGKLAARLILVLGLVGCAWPVVALGLLLGGIDPLALTGAFVVTLGLAVLGCCLALTLSIWASKTHEVLLATYGVWCLWLLGNPIWRAFGSSRPPAWLEKADPFLLSFAPYLRPGSVGTGDYVVFLGAVLLISTALVGLAVARVRAVAVRQADRPARRRKDWAGGRFRRISRLLGPSLDQNPVLWREWHRNRPSWWVRVVWMVYFVGAGGFTLIVLLGSRTSAGTARALPAFTCGFQVSIGLLLLSATAVTALAEERVRGSLDVLMASPLPTRSIVWGKWWGTYRSVPVLAVLPTIVAAAAADWGKHWLAVGLIAGLVLAYGAALTSLGLALATWIPRLGRAMALTVVAYVFMTVGWFFLIIIIEPFPNVMNEGLAQASPFFGPGNMAFQAGESGRSSAWPICAVWAALWIGAYSAAALGLLVLTLATFNRCLGRASESPRRPPSDPRARIGTALSCGDECL